MNTKSKVLAAGLAILMAGAAIGWGASRLNRSQQLQQDPLAVEVAPAPQEQPRADLTPQIQFHSAPTRRATVHRVRRASSLTLPAGTELAVALETALSSKTAYVGQSWSGTITEPVVHNGREVIPAGSPVRGVVSIAEPAERGNRATLQLALRSVVVNGRSYPIGGSSEAVVAGSPRTRNVAAVAGGAAAGALIGRAIGHSNKATVIGALIGGGAGTAAVAASKGYQATIEAGRQLDFTTS